MIEDSNPSSEGQPTTGLGSARPPALGRKKVGRYEVIYPLGQGGMASVHVARLVGMAGFERLVALKVIHTHLGAEKSFVEMFLDEARIAAKIHHPNVGEIFEVGEDDGFYYMAGELIMGSNISQLLSQTRKQGVPISHVLSADIASSIALGLHEAHELVDEEGQFLNVVHRDATPRNILISHHGHVKLIDFGVAYARERLTQTENSSLKGKIAYMPAEQIRGEPLDRRSDLFALGVTLYYMVTGHRAFPGENDAERMQKILGNSFKKPSEVDPSVSPELEQIIMTAMSPDREARYPTAAAMGDALEAYARSTDAPVGVRARAGLMKTLFPNDLLAHRRELRDFRKSIGDSAQFLATDNSTAGSKESAEEAGTEETGKNPPVDETPRHGRRGLFAAIIGISVTGAILAFIFGISSPGTDDDTRAAPNSRNDPDEPVVSPNINPSAETSQGPAAMAGQSKGPTDLEAENGDTTTALSATVEQTIALDLKIRPSTATISVDGVTKAHGSSSLRLPADSKTHRIEITAPGYRSEERTVVADRNTALSVTLRSLRPSGVKPVSQQRKKRRRGTSSKLQKNPYE
jgi:serine/threonine-protein kinase